MWQRETRWGSSSIEVEMNIVQINTVVYHKNCCLSSGLLQDIEILGWCPVGSVLPHASLAFVGHPSSDGITMKIPYREDLIWEINLNLIWKFAKILRRQNIFFS